MADRKDREQFIPIRKSELVGLLCGEPSLTAVEREKFRQLCEMLGATFHFEYHVKLEQLKDSYAPFDPDADCEALLPDDGHRDENYTALFDRFIALLERANFRRLTRDDIAEALKGASDWGLNLQVNFDVFDRLELFARGDCAGRRSRRRWRNLWRLEEVDVPIFRRLVLILRLCDHKNLGAQVDTDSVYIKVFKDIPKQDLEMLLPGTQVKISLFDRGRIALPALSGVAITIWKIVKGAILIAAAGAFNTLAYLGLLGGTVGYGIKSFLGYLRTKQKYQLNLTQSLYYQNLDNNTGALCRLLDEAEEQECREAILAYFFLWRHAGEAGWSARQLDEEIEQFLETAARVRVDFEIGDALAKLKRLELVTESADGRLRAVPIQTAIESLDRAWDTFFQYNQSGETGTIASPDAPQASAPTGNHAWTGDNRSASSLRKSA